jgi:16S rRNA (cytosine967-C5)-methyltransferase
MRDRAVQSQAQEALAVARHVIEAVERGRPADAALAACFRANRRYGSRDRRFFGAALFAYFRWKGWLDGIPDLPRALAAACWLDAQDEFPALAHWGERPPHPPPGVSLPELARHFANWQGLTTPPSPEALVPEWLLAAIPDDGAPDFTLRFLASLQKRPPLWLRARAGRRDAVLAHLASHQIRAEPDPRLPHALRVEQPPSASVLSPILHRLAEIQDISSQCVGLLAQAKPGETWWDVCAGAGGKTLHLLDQLGGSGAVLATDIRGAALDECARRARAAGFHSWKTQLLPEAPEAWRLPQKFDGILLDAPCSGTGTWGRAPDARWRTPQTALAEHATRQHTLLRAALHHLKPAGRLIYATCSLTRAELEDVLANTPGLTPAALAHPLRPTHSASPTLRIYPFDGPGIGMSILEIST